MLEINRLKANNNGVCGLSLMALILKGQILYSRTKQMWK